MLIVMEIVVVVVVVMFCGARSRRRMVDFEEDVETLEEEKEHVEQSEIERSEL